MTKVSVLVAVYNTADYLPQCLDSLLAQTMADIEVLCVDDGSTDASQLSFGSMQNGISVLNLLS